MHQSKSTRKASLCFVFYFELLSSVKMPATKTQIQIISSYMESHPELAKSYNALSSSGRTSQKHKWEQLARSLNANGPPSKTVAEWKRIWTLRKYKTKKKLTDNKKSINKTGGGPFDLKQLDETEEAIAAACGMEAAVTGIVGGLTFGSAIATKEPENREQRFDEIEQLLDELIKSPNRDKDEFLQDTSKKQSPSPKKTLQKENKADDVLKKQLQLQENFFSKQLETLGEIRDAIRQLVNIREKESENATYLKKEELEIRKRELEVAKIVNDLKFMELSSKTK